MHRNCLIVAAASLMSWVGVQGATIAYTDGGAVGNNTGSTKLLNIGREFSVSGIGITVDDLGIYAEGKTGSALSLSSSHVVGLFSITPTNTQNPTATLIASGSVPAGTPAVYQNGFAFAPITATYLAPGNYAVIAYGLDNGNEAYGDAPGNGAGRLSSTYANDLGFDPYQFSSNSTLTNQDGSVNFPNGGDGNNHNGASFLFDEGNTTPEPGSLCLVGLSGMALLARRKR